jgi:hypothetical protein
MARRRAKAEVIVWSYYTMTEGGPELEHGSAYVVPALPGETPEGTLGRKQQGAQKHGYTVLRFDMAAGVLETQKYFDDWTEDSGDFYKKRYVFTIEG